MGAQGGKPASNGIRSFFMAGATGQNCLGSTDRKMRQGNGYRAAWELKGASPPRMGSGLFLWPVQPDKIAWAQLIERCGREMDIEPQGSSRGQDPPRIGSVLFLWPVLPAIKKDPDLRRGQDIRSGGGGISLSAVSIPHIAAPRKAQMFPHDAHFRLQTARKHGIL